MTFPTAGLEANPEVVSDSPHFVDHHRSEKEHSVRRCSLAHCTNCCALRDAISTVFRSPLPSIEKPATGLPVSAIPSTIFFVQTGSIPITTQAATLGFLPVPMRVSK